MKPTVLVLIPDGAIGPETADKVREVAQPLLDNLVKSVQQVLSTVNVGDPPEEEILIITSPPPSP